MTPQAFRLTVLALFLFGASLASPANSAEPWGSLTGRFVIHGDIPPVKKLPVTKDLSYCAKYTDEIVDESLLVGKRGGIANLYIWIRVPRGREIPIHPDFYRNQKSVHIKSHHCRFQPRAVALWAGQQSLKCINQDPIGTTFSLNTFRNPPSSILVPINQDIELKYQEPEPFPLPMRCHIHPWKQAWVMIHDTPYVAMTDAEGRFELPNLPVGTWEFQLWHERTGYVVGRPEWVKGRFQLEIRPGKNTLGKISFEASLFQEKP